MLLEVTEQPRKHDRNQSAGIFPLLMQLYKTKSGLQEITMHVQGILIQAVEDNRIIIERTESNLIRGIGKCFAHSL